MFQIALMAVLGIVAKLQVPYAHTSLEFIRIRYGAHAHGIFVVLKLINNIFGCGGMILAGAQLVSGMTGMHIAAAGIFDPCWGGHLHRSRRAQSYVPHGLPSHYRRPHTLDLLLSCGPYE